MCAQRVGDLADVARDADADHGLPGEPHLQRVGDGDDLHDVAVDELLHPLPDRRLGEPYLARDGDERLPAVLLEQLDDALRHVVERRRGSVGAVRHGRDPP